MSSIGDVPCPNCNRVFEDIDQLYTHVLHEHTTEDLTKLMGEHMPKPITKADFTQIDSSWAYSAAGGGFHLLLAPNSQGEFRLQVFLTWDVIPAATQYPTQPEWDTAIRLANKFKPVYDTAIERTTG